MTCSRIVVAPRNDATFCETPRRSSVVRYSESVVQVMSYLMSPICSIGALLHLGVSGPIELPSPKICVVTPCADLALRAPVGDQRVGRPRQHVDEARRDGEAGGVDDRRGGCLREIADRRDRDRRGSRRRRGARARRCRRRRCRRGSRRRSGALVAERPECTLRAAPTTPPRRAFGPIASGDYKWTGCWDSGTNAVGDRNAGLEPPGISRGVSSRSWGRSTRLPRSWGGREQEVAKTTEFTTEQRRERRRNGEDAAPRA